MAEHSVSHAKAQMHALEDHNTLTKLEKLRHEWPTLSNIERGERLKELRKLGCTGRGMAVVLACDEGTVRRYIDMAELPPEDRKSIEEGANPQALLRHQSDLQERAADESRLAQEKEDGSVSDTLAWNIIWFASRYAPGFLFYWAKDDRLEDVCLGFHCRFGRISSNWQRARWRFAYPDTRNRRNLSLAKLADQCFSLAAKHQDISPSACLMDALPEFVEKLENRLSIIDMGFQKARRIAGCFNNCCKATVDTKRHRMPQCVRGENCYWKLVGKAHDLPPEEYRSLIENAVPEVRQAIQITPYDYEYARRFDVHPPNSFPGVPL